MTQFYSIISTTWWLIRRELHIVTKDFFNSAFDCLIMPISFVIIGGYILPTLGMSKDYGSLMAVGSMLMITWGTCLWMGAGPMVADLEGNRTISYELVLPIPPSMLVIKTSLGFALKAIILNILGLPISKLLLWDRFDLSQFSLFKFILIYTSSAILFGLCATAIAFWTGNSFRFGRFWCRVGAQLTFFGGAQFAWISMYKAWPPLGYIGLLNPLLYAFEGTRAAVLGQEGNLNYWLCLVVVWVLSIIIFFIAKHLMKKNLDCV